MRLTAAIGALFVLGCDPLGRHAPERQREFARSVVMRRLPVANVQREHVTWPIWGSAFDLSEVVRVHVSLEAGAGTGLVFAFEGPPNARAAYMLDWTGSGWQLAERIGDATPVQQRTFSAKSAASFVVEISDAGHRIRVFEGGTERAVLTATARTSGATMGIYVRLDPGTQLAIDRLAITQPLARSSTLRPLKSLAEIRGRTLGSTSETGDWPPRHDLEFESLYAEQFDTAGVLDFYWTTTRGEDADYNFLPADLMVNYASVHHQTINGYFLVWDEELPAWLSALASRQGASGIGKALDQHIATVVGRYRGRVKTWIVVNEAFIGPDETDTDRADYRPSLWYETLGASYIERAFRDAHAADPDARLMYNETGAEIEGVKSDFMYARLAELKAKNVRIDSVGLQFHIDAAAPPDFASVKRNMQRLGALGLDVMITELDISLTKVPGTHAARLARQAQLYASVTQACLEVPACKSITFFGFADKHAWDELGPAKCNPEGSTALCAEPLLYTRDYVPKPAYDAVRAKLGG